MQVNLRTRLLKGFGANLYGQLVIVLVQLLGVPILLHFWGPRLYGEWLIVFAIPSFLSLTDLGFSQSAANDMSQKVARKEWREAVGVFQTLCALVFGAAFAGLVLITGLLWASPFQRVMHLTAISATDLRWIVWLLSAEIFVRLTEGICHAGFRATGGYALHTAIYYTTLFLQYMGIWVVAALGYGPLQAAFAFLGIRCIVTPIVARVLVRRQPWLRFGFENATRAELRRLLKPAAANLVMPLAQAINIQGMILVVGGILGPVSVVVFSTVRTLTRLALQPVIGISNTAEPELASAYGAGNQHLMRSIFTHTLRLQLWLALTATLLLALFGGIVFRVWTHGNVPFDQILFHWMLTSATAGVLWYGALVALKAANRHVTAAVLYCGSSAAVVALAAFLLVTTGRLANAGLSLLLMDAIMTLYTLRAASSLMGATAGECLTSALNPFRILDLVRRSTDRS